MSYFVKYHLAVPLFSCLLFSALSAPAYAQYRVDARVTTFQGSCPSCDFSKKRMNGIRLQDSDFSKSLFNNSNLSGARIDRSNLSEAIFRKALLLRVTGNNVNMSNASFKQAVLTEAVLENSNLQNTHFFQADMIRSRFNGTDFSGSNLSGALAADASFEDCDFTHTHLNNTDFRNAILRNVVFTGADFGQASLKNADLSGAVLSHANLSSVLNLNQTQLNSACGNAQTRLPHGLSIAYCAAKDDPKILSTQFSSVTDPTIIVSDNDMILKTLDDTIVKIDRLIYSLTGEQENLRHELEAIQNDMRSSRRRVQN